MWRLGIQPPDIDRESLRGWLIGAICAVILTLTLVFGLGRAWDHRPRDRYGTELIQGTDVATSFSTSGAATPTAKERGRP
jgi:hypothetical protein